MEVNLEDFISYLECPRQYLHRILNPNKKVEPRWLSRKKIILDLALGNMEVINAPRVEADIASAEVLRGFILNNAYVQKTWEVPWGKGGKYTIVHKGIVDEDDYPVYIHISSSPYKQFPLLQLMLMLLKQRKIILVTHGEPPKVKQKKDETIHQFARRFGLGVQYSLREVTITNQEAEANKHWILQSLNKLRNGNFSQFSPYACMRIVDICPFYHLCWSYAPREV